MRVGSITSGKKFEGSNEYSSPQSTYNQTARGDKTRYSRPKSRNATQHSSILVDVSSSRNKNFNAASTRLLQTSSSKREGLVRCKSGNPRLRVNSGAMNRTMVDNPYGSLI